MAKDKKSFVAYCDWKETFDLLTDEEAGQLIKHIFAYVTDENPTLTNRIIELSFSPIKQDLKRDLKKWETYIDKQKANGKKGGRPKTQKTQPFFKKPKKADNVNVNDNVYINIYNKDLFLKDWNTIRTEVTQKPSHLNRLNNDLIDLLKTVDQNDCRNALRGFFKQRKFPNDMDYTVNPKHFLNHFDLYLQAYHDKNPNVWGKNE